MNFSRASWIVSWFIIRWYLWAKVDDFPDIAADEVHRSPKLMFHEHVEMEQLENKGKAERTRSILCSYHSSVGVVPLHDIHLWYGENYNNFSGRAGWNMLSPRSQCRARISAHISLISGRWWYVQKQNLAAKSGSTSRTVTVGRFLFFFFVLSSNIDLYRSTMTHFYTTVFMSFLTAIIIVTASRILEMRAELLIM